MPAGPRKGSGGVPPATKPEGSEHDQDDARIALDFGPRALAGGHHGSRGLCAGQDEQGWNEGHDVQGRDEKGHRHVQGRHEEPRYHGERRHEEGWHGEGWHGERRHEEVARRIEPFGGRPGLCPGLLPTLRSSSSSAANQMNSRAQSPTRSVSRPRRSWVPAFAGTTKRYSSLNPYSGTLPLAPYYLYG